MRIVTQILIEVLSVSIVAISLALFSGSLLSNGISRQMLETQMLEQQSNDPMGHNNQIPWELQMFSPGRMSKEDMMNTFDASMSGATIGIFMSVGLATVLVSTVAPIIYVVRLNPKKIMI